MLPGDLFFQITKIPASGYFDLPGRRVYSPDFCKALLLILFDNQLTAS